ncbi:MAG: hypothetical protein ABIW82_11605, partial [Dokdonella sp.]
ISNAIDSDAIDQPHQALHEIIPDFAGCNPIADIFPDGACFRARTQEIRKSAPERNALLQLDPEAKFLPGDHGAHAIRIQAINGNGDQASRDGLPCQVRRIAVHPSMLVQMLGHPSVKRAKHIRIRELSALLGQQRSNLPPIDRVACLADTEEVDQRFSDLQPLTVCLVDFHRQIGSVNADDPSMQSQHGAFCAHTLHQRISADEGIRLRIVRQDAPREKRWPYQGHLSVLPNSCNMRLELDPDIPMLPKTAGLVGMDVERNAQRTHELGHIGLLEWIPLVPDQCPATFCYRTPIE